MVLFQPHRYSRTIHLGEAFHTAFYDSDVLFLAPIYAAGEEPVEGVDSEAIGEGVRSHGHKNCEVVDDLNDAARRLRMEVRSGDLVLTLGAGDVWRAGRDLLDQLKEQGSEAEEAG